MALVIILVIDASILVRFPCDYHKSSETFPQVDILKTSHPLSRVQQLYEVEIEIKV